MNSFFSTFNRKYSSIFAIAEAIFQSKGLVHEEICMVEKRDD